MVALSIALSILTLVYSRKMLIYSRSSKAVLAIKKILVTSDSGISLPGHTEGELGKVYVSTHSRRSRRTVVGFSAISKISLNYVSYRDLCFSSYLLALDAGGSGYLEAPAIRVISEQYRNTFIVCLNPLVTPRLTKRVDVFEDASLAEGVVELVSGYYQARATSLRHDLPSWRLVYDAGRGIYRIVKELGESVRVGEVRVEVCVKPLKYLPTKICATIVRSDKLGLEEWGRLEGLTKLKILVFHKDSIDLFKLSREVNLSKYPHISGYSEGLVSVKLVLESSPTRRVEREEIL
ncbi:MAG: hypothetical protein RMI56_02925 [Sulfolobales archaeon]|nr:hypothetical protein [Sulfolobales archaeon]MDW8082733.1 hypothetical protein [Sulfolobales archaeon]